MSFLLSPLKSEVTMDPGGNYTRKQKTVASDRPEFLSQLCFVPLDQLLSFPILGSLICNRGPVGITLQFQEN